MPTHSVRLHEPSAQAERCRARVNPRVHAGRTELLSPRSSGGLVKSDVATLPESATPEHLTARLLDPIVIG